ncbi:MAG: YfhO family protein [Chitinophagaceae bacterium]
MKNNLVKKILPHFIAVLIFLIVSVLFCKPVLEGNVLNQHDVKGWKGIAQNAFDYKEQHGHFPLWNSNVFSGMPNYQIALDGKSILPDLNKIFSLGLPDPIHYFFIACICFYILCLSLGLKPVVGILGALAYAFSTYNPVILSAGHMTKMLAIAYMPLLLAGLILIYEKKYWLGLALTSLGTFMEIGANHPQINFYFFIVAAAVTIGYVVAWIRAKEWRHAGIAFGVTVLAALAGIAACSFSFLIGSDYAKHTIRGGQNLSIEGDNVKANKTKGLDTSYAFQYSFMKAEPLVALMPNAFGGSSANPLDENSNVLKKLIAKGLPESTAGQVAGSLPRYWGGLESTSGPAYMGAIICILALIGFVLVKHPLRWGLLAASLLGIIMSWGKFLPGINVFLFENLPLYNKFRAPSMSLVMVQLALPIMAVLTIQQLFFEERSRENLKANFKKILYTLGGLVALLGLIYLVMDYSSPFDGDAMQRLKSAGANDEIIRATVAGLKADRSAMFGGQLLRTLAYIALLLGLMWLYIKNTLKPFAIVTILAVVILIDLLVIDKEYLNEDNYQSKDEMQAENFTKTPSDEQILADKSLSYRVYNSGGDRFSASDFHISAFHKAIGGYHPAKLRIYQDVIERYLYSSPNPQVLNMLNAKYIVAQNPQTGQQSVIPNPEAYGNCWFVKNIKFVKDDVEEIQTIGNTNLRDTAIVQQSFAKTVTQPQWDSASSISLTKFDNDAMEYTADCRTPQFAVFSEVYYPDGWDAYIDGKKADYVKTNYVLRGMSIPAGKHTIKFIFEPAIYKKGTTISYIGSWFVLLFVVGGLFMAWKEQKTKTKLTAS